MQINSGAWTEKDNCEIFYKNIIAHSNKIANKMDPKIVAFLFCILQFLFGGVQSQLRQCWNTNSDMAKNPYFIGTGFTCCNNILMDHPLKPKSEHWKKCMSKQHGDQDNDVPSTLWSVYMCELSSAAEGAFSEDNLMYKQFEAFYMKNYPPLVKDKVLSMNVNCEASPNATISKKLATFESCFSKAEEETCFGLAGVKLPPPPPVPLPERRMCAPLESLPKPNHAFETFAQPCCKGEELPYPLFDIFMDFDRFDIAPKVVACSDNMKNRLKELNHSITNSVEPFTMCQVACVHEVDGLEGKYNTNFQDLLNFKLKSISNTTRSRLVATISKYQPTFKLYESETTVEMEGAADTISKLDEAQKIINYCKFQFEATAEAYRALYEHCYNSEYGNQFREDILKTTSKKG